MFSQATLLVGALGAVGLIGVGFSAWRFWAAGRGGLSAGEIRVFSALLQVSLSTVS